jgi:PPOX class probable F420-dependent enzyme
MSIDKTQVQQVGNDPFAYLYSYEFVVLYTFRKDGREVPTTVWFVHENGNIYVTTSTTAGKMKRVRNNRHVFLAPSDRIGNLLGERVEGQAREVPQGEHGHLYQLFTAKYPQFVAMVGPDGPRNGDRTYIEITYV